MRLRYRLLALLAVFALVVAACGGDDDDAADTTAATDDGATETTAAATDGTEAPDEPMDEPMEIQTDVGVDLDAGTITVGMLSDLTGPFGPLINPIVEGHRVFWEDVNANGGIGGLSVELEIVDTGYVVDNHVQLYAELKDKVVAFGHSTGSPHTVAINPDLQADGILAIPLTWYSGWSDPAINSNLVPHGAPYCIEAMSLVEYVAEQTGVDSPKIAIASLPGDYGLDSAAGAALAAEALGLEVVYDGSGAIIPSDETTLTAVAEGIATSGADMVFVTTTPSTFGSVYGQALATGFQALWTGAGPTWSPAFVAPDSAIKDAIARDFYVSSYLSPWFSDGSSGVRDLMAQYSPDSPPFDYYGEGIVEATILKAALDVAYANGDLTQAGVLAAAKSLESVDFGGLAPTERYVGNATDIVQRAIYISRPDPAGLAAGTSTGVTDTIEQYTSPVAAAYTFESACFSLG